MNEISLGIGAQFFLVNLPGLCRDRNSRVEEQAEIIQRDMHISAATFPFWVAVKSFESALIWDLARRHNIPIIDVHQSFEAFSGIERVNLFTDEMHHTASGTEQIAEAVRLALRQAAP